ncbi:MAG TPA: histidine kinase [Candidatus Saccharimonadales bacterium]|nr:histidine kinase [Candidatus Saccharimonadales bacterium]
MILTNRKGLEIDRPKNVEESGSTVVNRQIRILMLEDNVADAELIKFALREGGLVFSWVRVDSKAAFLREMEKNTPNIILLDYSLPSFDGLSALHLAQQRFPNVPFIFVTGTLGEEVVIEMLKSGATDYVLKNRLSRLVPAVLRALREKEERDERQRAEERLRKSYEQLRALSVYLQYVREDERIRISRQVHDELGQALTGLKLDLYWLAHRLPRQLKSAQEKAKTMSANIDTTIQTVRRISTELRPSILDDLGLVAALEWQAAEFQKRTGIKCAVVSDLKEPIMNEDLNTAFFRIFQETLTNIIRHAQATLVEISLRKVGRFLQLQVKDNGRGISENEMNDTRSIGLLGMRERAALLGGTLQLKGVEGQGTTVTVKIPASRRKEVESGYHENTHR